MLRERRRHANFKPNRRLDRKSSRGMIFENEELRLRTININAEVERGQSDIRKLRRENDQLRREIWCLRDEYDRLDKLLRHNVKEGGKNASDSDSGESCDTCGEEEDEAIEEEEEEEDEEAPPETAETTENEQNNLKANLHVKFDHLSIVSEENLACSGSSSSHTSPPPHTSFSALSPPDTPDLPKIHDLQSVGPPLSHFENIFSAIPYEDLEKCIEKPVTEAPRSPVSPTRNFQSGGNLDDLLQDIEALSQGILQMQTRDVTASLETPKMTKYRSEVNLVLSSNGQEAEEAQKPDIILMQSEMKPPEPMPILSALYPLQPEGRKFVQQQTKENFDAILKQLPSVSSHILTPKILSVDEAGSSGGSKSNHTDPGVQEKSQEAEKNKEKTPNCPSSSEESRRKSRRVSLYFNGKKSEEVPAKEASAPTKVPLGFERISGESSSATPAPGPSATPQHHRKNSEVPKHKKKRTHRNSDRNSHNPPSDDALFERNSVASSRESSASASTRSQKSRRISINSHAGGKIPWCACWGNGCI